jgi:hypothetical protein
VLAVFPDSAAIGDRATTIPDTKQRRDHRNGDTCRTMALRFPYPRAMSVGAPRAPTSTSMPQDSRVGRLTRIALYVVAGAAVIVDLTSRFPGTPRPSAT